MHIYTAIHTSPSAGPVGYRWLVKQVAGDCTILPKAYECIARDLPCDTLEFLKGNIKRFGGLASVDKEWGIVYRVLYGGRDAARRDGKLFLACGLFKRTAVTDMDVFSVLEEKEFTEVDETGSGRREIVLTRRVPSQFGNQVGSKNASLNSENEIRLAMSQCLSLPESQTYRLKFIEDKSGWKGNLHVGAREVVEPPEPPEPLPTPTPPDPPSKPSTTMDKVAIASLVLAGFTAVAVVYFGWNVYGLRKDIDDLQTSISELRKSKISTPEYKSVQVQFGDKLMTVMPVVQLGIEIDDRSVEMDRDFQLEPSKSHRLKLKIGNQIPTEIMLKEPLKAK